MGRPRLLVRDVDSLNLLLENQPTFVDDIVFFIEINRMPMVSDDVP